MTRDQPEVKGHVKVNMAYAISHRLYSVDLIIYTSLAKHVLIKCIASKCASNFDWDCQRVNAFYHCVYTLTRDLLSQIIS